MLPRFTSFRSLALCSLAVVAACDATAEKKAANKPDASDSTSEDPIGETPETPAITSDGRFLRDDLGRAMLLRGVNARVNGVFDVELGEGRVPLEPIPEFGQEDCRQMAEWGINLLRLPIQWSGIEPERDSFDEAYLKRVDAVIDCAYAAGVAVLVDLHQDAYSKEIGEDGAPLWAIVPTPDQLLEGPLTAAELQRRRFSPAVGAAFTSFFDAGDKFELQAEYIAMLEHVGARYAKHPGVVGIDLFNEPVTSPDLLRRFHRAAAEAVHKVAPNKLVFFEPTGPRGYTGSEAAVEPPFGVEGAVYAPHLYPAVFLSSEEQLLALDIDDLRPTFNAAADEASDWKTPWLVGEFGGPATTALDDKYLGLMYRLLDERFVSATLWLWKEDSQDSWGMFEADEAGAFSPRPQMVEIVSRPYVERAAGTPTRMVNEGGALELAFNDGVDASHRIYVPERLTIATVTCDGQTAEATKVEGVQRYEIRCGDAAGEHVLRVQFQ